MIHDPQDGSVIGYMDLTDFECELGSASDGNKVYPSVEALRKAHAKCIDHCGIIKVKVVPVRIVQEPASYEEE